MFIDTHCHLDYLSNPDQAIVNASKAGVKIIIAPGVNSDSSQKCINFAKKYSKVYAAVGLHPIDVKSQNLKLESQFEIIRTLIKQEKKYIVALGECGLDFAPASGKETNRSNQDQIALFKNQVQLALKYQLPLIIHNRKADQQLIDILTPFKGKINGVFHCFCQSKNFLKQIIDLGFYLGLTGLISYDLGLQQVLKHIPENKILIETDSPYLMPEPIRKTKKWPNLPENVKIVADWIAKIKGDSFLRIAKKTTKNAYTLFGLNKK